ncbi:MAG: o-succinylbenzoate synthase [Actinobacteria bacterium]|uniref:o-succinylbenzoate synthase n=1 Tax=freshwater metagenome TaxID=449393 RepID=A0A6J6FVZ0_9ZZZZ|nr:o-succinylbenzoate synthase [Actinomycetota bacterium]
MKIVEYELRRIHLPLVRPFRTSFGTQSEREVLLVKVTTEDGVIGWAECVAMSAPLYSPEYVSGCLEMMRTFLIPALNKATEISAAEVGQILKPFLGAQMAKAALETAVLDAELKIAGISLANYLGANKTKVPCGVSVGIAPSIEALVDEVTSYVEAGYKRIKLKIEPGWDITPVRKIRELFPDKPLQVDANQAYSRTDFKHLKQLDEFNLLLIEQPLEEHDILGHAQLAEIMTTPICLDESIISLHSAQDALELKATSVINIKPGRVGGYLESARIHNYCLEKSIPVWCGGMLETGIGRAANLALAALPGFTLPGDTSASSRFFKKDITTPFEMIDGHLEVPNGVGIGVSPDIEYMNSITKSVEIFTGK